MTPRHHFPDEVLLEYAAGTAFEAVALAVACHVSLCAACRERVAWLDQLGGTLLESEPAAGLDAGALERALARLSEPVAVEPLPEPARAPTGLEFVPRPLWPYLSEVTGPTGRFTEVVPGIGSIELQVAPPGGTARLVDLDPTICVPEHDHGGPEYGVVLAGGLGEADGQEWHRGDAFYRTPGEQHLQRVLPGPHCVALVVNAGSLIPLSEAGAVLKLFSA